MIQKKVFAFPSPDAATLEQVGGKGLSLMISSKEGLPVPPGFILSVAFFTPWFSQLKATQAWTNFLKAEKDALEKACNVLKHNALQYTFTKEQKQELAENLQQYDHEVLFAVRSSSPEEDLEGASFAGGYETILGVTTKNIEAAIKKAFISCLDYRVAVYKRENGFDVTDPKIAIIVQEQIASDVAGVGFSLNPVTNNYDEAIFNANWGLGETVVAGIATPDTFTVDKVLLKIKDKTLGTKETSIWLTTSGGTEEKPSYRSHELTLSDEQIIALTKLIKNVENLYQKPIDIEWAFSHDKLYLLQARPISAYVPLSSEMITPPGARKRLYIDFTISVQGIYTPLSVTATTFFLAAFKTIGKILFLRDITRDITTSIPWVTNGRLFINLSSALRIAGKEKLVRFITILDPLAAQAIQTIDEKKYISPKHKIQLLPIGLVLQMPRITRTIYNARMHPEQTHQELQQKLAIFMQKARALAEENMPITTLTATLFSLVITDVLLYTVPLFISGKIAFGTMKRLAGKELEHAFDPLEVALPHNVTTQMGLELYHVSELLPKNLTLKRIEGGLREKSLPQPFMSAWENFLNVYGHRGPREIDIATPRYRDDPQLLLSLLLSMKDSSSKDNPQEKFTQNQKDARAAYDLLYKKILAKSEKKAKHFQEQYKIYETFGGYRETHKFYLIFVIDVLRQRILKEAKVLTTAGRLQSIGQVFDLKLEDMDRAMSDTSFDLQKQAEQNKQFINRLAKVAKLPTIIDSRGFIPRPPTPPVRAGEVAGTAISPGIVQGRIKVLHTPNEKPLNKGEILVARATDPGWTPLFVNAAAVILEVGGVLQHGALVAREYGLPCVAGIENATNLWKDGTLVEVDGSTGIIRLVKKS
jgi:phosphohistidine swiveling domain-containing protein